MLRFVRLAGRKSVFFHVLLAIPLLLLFHPTIFRGHILEGVVDRREITLPIHYLNCRAFASGQYPQWNPYLFNGVPLSTIGMDYAWSPFNWPLYLLGGESQVPLYFTWVQMLKHLFTGVLAFLFFRRVVPGRVCAGLAAVAYAWSAPTVWNMVTSEFMVFLFLPAGMHLLHLAAERLRPVHVVLFAVILAIDIGGGVLQWSFYLWLFWGAYALYLSFGRAKLRVLRVHVPSAMALFVAGSVLAAMLSAPKLVPFVLDLRGGEAVRGQDLSLSGSVEYSRTPPLAMVRLFSSNILGNASYEYWSKYPLLGCPGEARNYAETMLAHAGLVPLVLACLCPFIGEARRRARFPLIVLAVVLLVLPGTPITYLFVAATSTGLKYGRLALFLPFFTAWAAGCALAHLNRAEVRANRPLKVAVAVLGAFVALGLVEVFRAFASLTKVAAEIKGYYARCMTGSLIILGVAAVAGGALWVVHARRLIAARWFRLGLLLITLAELYAGAAVFGVRTYKHFLRSPRDYFAARGNVRQVADEYARRQDFRVSTFHTPLSFAASPYPTAMSNITHGIPQASGFSNTIPRRVVAFTEALAGTKTGGWTVSQSKAFSEASAVAWDQVRDRDEFRFVRVADAPAPRATLTTRYRVVGSKGEVLSALRDNARFGPIAEALCALTPAFAATARDSTPGLAAAVVPSLLHARREVAQTVFLTSAPPIAVGADAAGGSVRWLPSGPNGKKLDVDAPCDALLYIRDSLYPGWTALVDGRKVDILSANYLFMAIPISKGPHEVRLEYANPHMRPAFGLAATGGVISIGLLAVQLLGARLWRRARPAQRPVERGNP